MSIKSTGLIALYLKSQQSFLSERGKFASNINELPDILPEMNEFKSWQDGNEYQVETWSNRDSAIIMLSSNSTKSKNYFGIIKFLKSKKNQKTGFISFDNLSFACAGKNNNYSPNKIDFVNTTSRHSTDPKKNNCPVGYKQIYQSNDLHSKISNFVPATSGTGSIS